MDERGDSFAFAQEEWLARLLGANPAAAQAPAVREGKKVATSVEVSE